MTGPERIWAARGLYTERKDNRWPEPTEYVRRDPAVLAELPEVKALVDAGTSLVSALCDDPDVMAKSHLVDLINELAAAIRDGRG